MDFDLEKLRIEHHDAPHAPPRSGRAWMVLFFVTFAGSAAALFYLERDRLFPGAIEVQVERLGLPSSAGTGSGSFSAAGWVKLPLYHPVYVTPLTAGRLEEILAIEGDRVTKGQVVARLFKDDYQASALAAQAALAVAGADHAKLKAGYRRQEIEEARAEFAREKAELDVAEEVLSHSRELHPTGAIATEELQEDQARAATARANVAKAAERLALLEEGFRQEEIALAAAAVEKARAELTLAQQKLSYTEIRSPIDGMVLERLASPGQWLTPEDGAVLSLFDPADLEARIDVNQDDLARVAVGQVVAITTRAEPDLVHQGKVILIEPKADLIKNTVPVRVKLLDAADRAFYPDMVVTARFLSSAEETERATAPPAVTVPVAAVQVPPLQADGEAGAVFVVEEGRVRRVEVRLGRLEQDRYEVVSGLQGGELVVVGSVEPLSDGAPVRIAPGRIAR
ncbi:MAG: efflux RND transporter periplasmic adaptor subunit [Planctomycetota bacterium]